MDKQWPEGASVETENVDVLLDEAMLSGQVGFFFI